MPALTAETHGSTMQIVANIRIVKQKKHCFFLKVQLQLMCTHTLCVSRMLYHNISSILLLSVLMIESGIVLVKSDLIDILRLYPDR